MAPFLVSHPVLINNWILARETAIAKMRGKRVITNRQKKNLVSLFDRAKAHLEQWQTADAIQAERISILQKEWKNLRTKINLYIDNIYPMNNLINQTSELSLETQELMIALVIEIGGDEIDSLSHCMNSDCLLYTSPSPRD